jgi:outer membrane receptor protein involved in Fe transport
VRLLFGRNNFWSSGQLPLDLVEQGSLDRFAALDPTLGGRGKLGTVSLYYTRQRANGDTLKADAFVSRSLLDLYSNFTYYLNDPERGDAFQQHDSRLQQGANAQYLHANKLLGVTGYLSAGANFHANQINVALYPRQGRVPLGVTTRAQADIANAAGYVQQNVALWGGRLLAGAGLRWDAFRFDVDDRVEPPMSGARNAARWQPKANVSLTPSRRAPLTLFLNYGRGISTADARAVVRRPEMERVATTDFWQAGAALKASRFALQAAAFRILRSNEQVYVPDDGSIEFRGPSRAYGFEAKASAEVTRKVTLNAGLTKVANAYYVGVPRVYVDSAPHFVANAGMTVSSWKGWSGSLRLRAINHYRLDGEDASVVAAGHTVFDAGLTRRLGRHLDFSAGVDNLFDRRYYETQNYFESRLRGEEPVYRIHATPGYSRTVTVGLTVRFRGK